MITNVLSIAGSDPSGGAGVQADLKTMSALGCYGMAVVTALTAQNTQGVSAVHIPPAEFIAQQIDAIFDDIEVHAVKVGMLANAEIATIVAERLQHHQAKNIVVDPVLVATSGDSLGAPDVVEAIISKLLPAATLITPNLLEAERLADIKAIDGNADLELLARALVNKGCKAVLVKGGHSKSATADDVLFDGTTAKVFSAPRIDTENTHGTGCTLSSAIAAHLAKDHELPDAIAAAKAYLSAALEASEKLDVGKGHGPVHHFHAFR